MTSGTSDPTLADLLPWLLIEVVRGGLERQHPEKPEFVESLNEAVLAWSHLSPSQQHSNLDEVVDLHSQLSTALRQHLRGQAEMPYGWWLDIAKPLEAALRKE